MNITRSNYESWFLDYIEGNLYGTVMDEFTEFIRLNPDLGEELRCFKLFKLENESVVFGGKNKLYKERLDIPSAFDHETVAFMEGDLSPEESTNFQDYLNRHPEKSPELESFLQTKLLPDTSLVFSRKQTLVKKAGLSVLFAWTIRVAAVLLLLLAVYTWSDQPEEKTETGTQPDPIAEINTPEEDQGKQAESSLTGEIRLVASATDLSGRKHEAAAARNINGNASVEPAKTEVAPEEYVRYEAPALLPLIHGFVSQDFPVTGPTLAYIENDRVPPSDEMHSSLYLSERVIEKLRLNEINLNKVFRTGLDLVVQLTNEKFRYNEDNAGKITAYQLETRLLGFSLPVGKSGQ
jgi:hypothetical protein